MIFFTRPLPHAPSASASTSNAISNDNVNSGNNRASDIVFNEFAPIMSESGETCPGPQQTQQPQNVALNDDGHDHVTVVIPQSSFKPSDKDARFIIQKVLNREHITDDEIISCLEKRWVPEAKDEFPYTVVQHNRR